MISKYRRISWYKIQVLKLCQIWFSFLLPVNFKALQKETLTKHIHQAKKIIHQEDVTLFIRNPIETPSKWHPSYSGNNRHRPCQTFDDNHAVCGFLIPWTYPRGSRQQGGVIACIVWYVFGFGTSFWIIQINCVNQFHVHFFYLSRDNFHSFHMIFIYLFIDLILYNYLKHAAKINTFHRESWINAYWFVSDTDRRKGS